MNDFGQWITGCKKKQYRQIIRGGVLEDTFWSPWPWPRRSSPWPWPRGLKSSKIGLSSAQGQHFFLNCWNFVDRLKKNFRRRFLLENAWKKFLQTFFFGDRLKKIFEDLFFRRTLALVSLASSIPVLGLERVCPRKSCSWPRIFFVSLALSFVSSTPPLQNISAKVKQQRSTVPEYEAQKTKVVNKPNGA